MAAAVMTRPSSSNKPAAAMSHKSRIKIPPRLQLSNGAASQQDQRLPSLYDSSGLQAEKEGSTRLRSSTHSGTLRIPGEKQQHQRTSQRDSKLATKTGKELCYEGGRERSSRLVLNGVLVESQLSPKTQESIDQVFSFDTKTADFEASVSQMWPHRCSFIVKEIIETERAYVEALGDIIKGYITPLYGYLLSSGDGPNFIQTVFSNIVKIHRYHLDLLDSFQSLCSRPKRFVQLFVDRDFGLYTEYCTNYSRGNEHLEQSLANNTELQTFILECQAKLDHSLPLHSHLIKPVQRILKYPLLLEELVKNFDDTQVGYSTIEEACKKMTEVAAHINASFQKPAAKKKSLTPNAIARIRSKEVEVLQRRRTVIPVSPSSPTTSFKSLTLSHAKRSLSVEPGDIGTTDRANLRTRQRKKNQKKRGRRHMSVEDLYPDEHAITSSSEDDHLARVSELKSFFENLDKNAATTACVTKSPALEVAPLELKKWSMFENPSHLDENKKKGNTSDDKSRTNKKSSRKPASPTSATKSIGGKETSKTKGTRKKQDS